MASFSPPRLCLALLFLSLLFTESACDSIDDLIQFEESLYEDDPVKDEHNSLKDKDKTGEEEDSVIRLWELKKPRWRSALKPYDTNSDGKLSGLELILAYPEIERLIKTEDEDSAWWNSVTIPRVGVVVAIVLGGAILIYAMKALSSARQETQSERENQHLMNKEQWLSRLEGNKQHSELKTDEAEKQHSDDKLKILKISSESLDNTVATESGEESTSKLHKRKPDAGRDLVSNKIARYQHLSAVRRQPGNQSENNSSGFYQRLLSDEDEEADNSVDEVLGNTRKRRQIDKTPVNEIHQKLANVLLDESNQNGSMSDEIGASVSKISSKSKIGNKLNKLKNSKGSQVKAENTEDLFGKNTEKESKMGIKHVESDNGSLGKTEKNKRLVENAIKEESKMASKPVRNNNSSPVKAENTEQLVSKNTEEESPKAAVVAVELSPELRKEAILKILSYVLDCNTVVEGVKVISYKSTNPKTLRLNLSHLPTQTDDVAQKIPPIIKVMTVRQVDKVKYTVTCFDRSSEKLEQQTDSVTKEVCQFLTDHFTDLIIKEVNNVRDADDNEDDLWTEFNSEAVLSSSVHALCRLAGWVEDGIVISQSLLSRLLLHQDGAQFFKNLFRSAGKQLMSVKRIDEVIIQEGRILRALEILLSNASCGELLAKVMDEEVKEAVNGLGNFFEKSSIFGPLLSVTTVPSKLPNRDQDMKSPAAIPFLELKNFPKPSLSDVRFLETNIQEALHRCQHIVYQAVMKVLTSKSTRESGLAWLAAIINLNDIRTTWSPDPNSQLSIGCSDGFMLNFCPVLVELFMPAMKSEDRLSRVNLDYSASESCRLNYDFEICLAGGQIVSQDGEEKKTRELLSENQTAKFNFLTECFHLCQRGLCVGVLPAISHLNRQLRQLAQVLEQVKGSPQEGYFRKLQTLITVMWDVSLIDSDLVRKISQFYLCQAQLVLKLIDSSEQGVDCIKIRKKLLSRIPEFCIKDMCIWFRLVARHGIYVHQDVLAGVSLAPFVDCCVALLSEQELMPGPVAASKVVSSLLSFVNSSTGRNDSRIGWGSDAVSNLAMMVFTCPSFMEKLGPALIRTYVSVDVVEGLDVDKDEFDKYSARGEITQLVEKLWEKFDSRTSILKMVDTKLFQDFLGSVLNTLLYMLHDSLTRVANIRKMELAKDNVEEWQRLSQTEAFEKDKFLKQEELTAKGFMTNANYTLEFIELLTKADVVAKCFTRQPLAYRAANAILGFLESLCGANCKDYKVKDGQKYNFDPRLLLNKIVSVILIIAEQDTSKTDGFVVSMATDDDFSPPTLEKALSVISRKSMTAQVSLDSFSKLIQTMKDIQSSKSSPEKGPRVDKSNQWQEEITSVKIDMEALCESYKTALADLRFDASHIQESHSFYGNAQDLTPGASKIKTLMKEMKQLRSNLPVHPDAAVFVRQDEDRIDLMRAMLTGPVDTPYSLGCFIFDVFFPNNYPNIPPLVKLLTTGNGTVRFNPNLYADGKVCLSLLGTWHAGDASEKWIPSKSSLYQVLVSIQSLILIPDPMFNEPGYEGLRGTTEGEGRSKTHNSKLRLWTVRHAMLGQLRSPPAGFEELILQHFTLQKDMVLKQCSDWLNDCADQEEEKRLRSVVNDLREELAKLEESPKLVEEVAQPEELKPEVSKVPETTEGTQLKEDQAWEDALYS